MSFIAVENVIRGVRSIVMADYSVFFAANADLQPFWSRFRAVGESSADSLDAA